MSEKQKPDCLGQIGAILMYLSSSCLTPARSDAQGKAVWPQDSPWDQVDTKGKKAGEVSVWTWVTDAVCRDRVKTVTRVTLSSTGWFQKGLCRPLPSAPGLSITTLLPQEGPTRPCKSQGGPHVSKKQIFFFSPKQEYGESWVSASLFSCLALKH